MRRLNSMVFKPTAAPNKQSKSDETVKSGAKLSVIQSVKESGKADDKEDEDVDEDDLEKIFDW